MEISCVNFVLKDSRRMRKAGCLPRNTQKRSNLEAPLVFQKQSLKEDSWQRTERKKKNLRLKQMRKKKSQRLNRNPPLPNPVQRKSKLRLSSYKNCKQRES